jgi:pimeloyl-ACP methyl ester carboxylesterase
MQPLSLILIALMTTQQDSSKARASERATVSTDSLIADSVISKDGTIVGYWRIGRGPGVILLHGTAESAMSHIELARALADSFTAYLPDRRGRGLSGPHGSAYAISKEVDDLSALVVATGAHNIFGVSTGAMVVLESALAIPAISKVAVLEPPLIINGSPSTSFLGRYDREIAEGKTAAALVTAMRGAEMGPAQMRALPRWILERMTRWMMWREDRSARNGDVTMRMLAPTLHFDFQLAVEWDPSLERFRGIRGPVLLLGGHKSAPYLHAAVDALAVALPDAKRVEFADAGHEVSGNANWRGKPDLVARELRSFFQSKQ